MAKTIAFYNLKGGVGKTASAVNLAWHAARWKHTTLLWDLDPQGAASWYLHADKGKPYTPTSLINNKQSIARLALHTHWPHLNVIPADMSLRTLDAKLVDAGNPKTRLRKALDNIDDDYALIILDCPPTLSPTAESIFGAAQYLFVPVIPTHLSVRAFKQVKQWLKDKHYGELKVIPFFNMVDRRRPLHLEMLEKPPSALRGLLKTWIPYSTHIEQMGEHRLPVQAFAPQTPAARAYRQLWHEIAGKLKL